MIPFWICLLKAVVCTLVSFHFVASIKNAKGKKNPKNGVEFECEYFLSRLRFCAKRQIDDKKNHFKISRDSFLLRKKEFQPLVSSGEPPATSGGQTQERLRPDRPFRVCFLGVG